MESYVDKALRWGPTAIWLMIFLLMYTHAVHADPTLDLEPPALTNVSGPRDVAPGMMAPLVAIDVNPGNSITPFAPHSVRVPNGRTLGFGFGIDKMLSPNWDIEVDSAFDSYAPHQGARQSGFDTIDVLSRMLFINQSDVQAAVAPMLSFGVGSMGSPPGLSNAGLALLGSVRGGALPEDWDLGYWRALEVHSDIGYSRILSAGSGDEFFFDPVIDYSLPYMQYLTRTQPPSAIRNLCVFAELNFDAVVTGSSAGAATLYTTPGISYVSDAYQVSTGVQLPLNHAAEHAQQIALLGEVQWSLDSLPLGAWMPF